MKTLHKTYSLATNGKILNISLIGMLRSLGLGGSTASGAIPADILDCLCVGLVSPNTSGEIVLRQSALRHCYYEVINRSILRIYLSNLVGGTHKLSVYARYGTNEEASLQILLNVPQNVPYLTFDGITIPLERDVARDEQGKQCYIYELGEVTVWVDSLDYSDAFTAFIGEGVDGVLDDAREVAGCSVVNNAYVTSYDMPSSIDFPAVNSFGDGGGGGGGEVDYNTDIYMDGYGRVILERLEDGSTMLLDESGNPIVKRMANGETEYYDAYQDVRYRVGAHGESTINDVLKLLGDTYVRGVGGFTGSVTPTTKTLQSVINGKIERVELECDDDTTIHVKGTTTALSYDEVKTLVDDPTKFVTLRYLDICWMLPSYDDNDAIIFSSTQILGDNIQVARVIMATDGSLNNYSIIGEDVEHKTSDLSNIYALDGHETYVATKMINELVGILSTTDGLYKAKLANGRFVAMSDLSNVRDNVVEVYSNKRGRGLPSMPNVTKVYCRSWDLSSCTDMDFFFGGCSSVKNLDVSLWDVSRVTSMNGVFNSCFSLTSLDLHSWDVSNVDNMSYIFWDCRSLKTLDISGWDASNVTNITGAFSGHPVPHCIITLIGGRQSLNETTLNGLRASLDLSGTNLDRPSIRAVINGLSDLTDSDSKTLILGATLRARLESEDIAIATGKNWVIA